MHDFHRHCYCHFDHHHHHHLFSLGKYFCKVKNVELADTLVKRDLLRLASGYNSFKISQRIFVWELMLSVVKNSVEKTTC